MAVSGTLLPAFGLLERAKSLRGTRFDPFGRTAMRRLERALVVEFESALDSIIASVTEANLAEATRIVGLPDSVRGYEELKLRRAAAYQEELATALASFG